MMTSTRPMGPDSKGFTLIEVIITIILLVAGMVSVISLFGTGLFADSQVESRTIAINLAQEKMEEIKDASSYSNIDSFASGKTALTGDFSGYSREVTVAGNPKQVNVIVYWNAKQNEQRVNLVTLFADYDY